MVEILKERLAGKASSVVGYGHIGDGNVHVNVTSDGFSREVLNLIEPFIFDYAGTYIGQMAYARCDCCLPSSQLGLMWWS